MVTLITALQTSLTRSQQLSEILQHPRSELGRVRTSDLEQALDALQDIDSIILLHGEPHAPLYSFVGTAKKMAGTIPVIVWDAPECPETVAEYLMTGARACFLDGHDPNDLPEALEAVRNGGFYLPPGVQRMLVDMYVEISTRVTDNGFGPRRDPDGLTEREQEVLELLVSGHTNPEIAKRLFLEVGTVKNHVHHILTKLDVPDRQAAARYYETRQRFAVA